MSTETEDALLARARELWVGLASAPVSFGPTGSATNISVAVSSKSRLCPPGWVGIVALGGSAIATAPTEDAARTVREALAPLAPLARLSAEAVCDALAVARVLGPATLAYAGPDEFVPARPEDLTVIQLPVEQHPEIRRLERLAGEEDAGEAGLTDITSPAFVIREGGEEGEVVAAAGYTLWPNRTAHISVLTAPAWRARGLARATASAATTHALTAGLLPQWRARPPASRRVARALGFRELGSQLSIELA